MGSLPRLESRPRMVLPDTPPELVSPTATSFSSRSSPSADHVWASQALASLPMSNYDKAAGRDDGHEHRERTPPIGPNSNPQRQQLPSLSSLFGPPSSMRPLHSSLPGRPAHHPRYSPLERPLTTAVGSPGSSSYFPAAVQPRTPYEAVTTSVSGSGSGSRSPGFADSRGPSEAEPRWSQHEATREYLMGSQDTSSPPLSSLGDVTMEYGQKPKGSTLNGGKGAVAESSTSKEGLGPKIWTGTHFLPRFIRAAEVPGEGLCYFYDDGTHCKTVIDGEVVNAHWGVTKAGKPRKRLAIACITCREKKIKCDPDYPRCIQCDKFGRVCKFKNAPRGGQNTSPCLPPAELHGGRAVSSPEGSRDSRSPPMAQPTINSGQTFDDSYHKRMKLGAKSYSPSRNTSLAVAEAMNHSKSPHQVQQYVTDWDHVTENALRQAWCNDISVSDPRSIASVIEQFFAHVDSTMILKFLPEGLLKAYLGNTGQQKLPEDLMLLYSILAIGVALSGGSKHIAHEYAQVAYYAQRNLGFNCLQLVQSRILLAAYYISADRIHDATELLSSAAAVSNSLQLNMELDRSIEGGMVTYPFGMTRDGYKESRRRTLWSLFMLERCNGVFPNRPAMINPQDLYIRLPTDNQSFENQVEREEPVFDPYTLTASTSTSSCNILANLVEMTHFWADCQVALYRIASRPGAASAESTRIQSLAKRIRGWYSSLPERLSFSRKNLEDSVYISSSGSFIAMHILYHHAMIKVNRHHSAASLLGSQLQNTYAHNCFGHATGILELIHTFDSLRRGMSSLSMLPHVTATAAVEAVDALTASGSMASISDQINSVREALMAVENLSNIWEDVRNARLLIKKRMEDMLYIREQGPRPTTPVKGYRVLDTGNGGRWQICEPIDKLLPKEMDIVYSIPL